MNSQLGDGEVALTSLVVFRRFFRNFRLVVKAVPSLLAVALEIKLPELTLGGLSLAHPFLYKRPLLLELGIALARKA